MARRRRLRLWQRRRRRRAQDGRRVRRHEQEQPRAEAAEAAGWQFNRHHFGKDGKVRDTGSVEPGSRPIFGSVSGSENQFLGI